MIIFLDQLAAKKRKLLEKQLAKEQAEKDHYIKQMMRDWPDTPGGELWCELVYDLCKQTPQEELDRIMESGEWDRPSKFSPEANTKMIAGG